MNQDDVCVPPSWLGGTEQQVDGDSASAAGGVCTRAPRCSKRPICKQQEHLAVTDGNIKLDEKNKEKKLSNEMQQQRQEQKKTSSSVTHCLENEMVVETTPFTEIFWPATLERLSSPPRLVSVLGE